MRNLKKILALVLALVMSLSLVTTAGAFSDDGDINANYQDAIDVLSGLDVFKGYSDGSFQPKGNITRAEVAAIIYRIDTGDVTDTQASIYSTWGKFKDVQDGAWYAGYVNYCANAEYIKGRGNGVFDPQATVTGYEALAMILRAVGYDKNGEFTGSNWQTRTASIGRERGILKNVTETLLGQAASRELVAEILFRSIVIPKVDFSANTLSYVEKANKDGKKQTIGYESFKLEEITGVITGNEYADLESGETMADGRTRMVVDGADRQVYNLEYSSTLDDIGESRSAYIVNGNLSKVLVLADSGDNVVYEDGVKKSPNDAAKDKGLKLNSDTEYYRNFNSLLSRSAKMRIEYVYEWNTTEYQAVCLRDDNGEATLERNDGKDANGNTIWTKITQTAAQNAVVVTKTTASLTKVDTYRYTKVIKADASVTPTDYELIQTIFREADRENLNERGYITGEVYVGTSSVSNISDWRYTEDVSDKISHSDFVSLYLNINENASMGENRLGQRLKVIDNDNDTIADYVLQTVYTVTKVDSVGSDSKYTFKTTDLIWTDDIDLCNQGVKDIKTRVMTGDSLNAGDVVLYAKIDGKVCAWLAESTNSKIDKVNRNVDPRTAVIAEGTEYKDSAVRVRPRPDVGLGEDVLDLIGGTTYSLYFDLFGNLAAFNEADEEFVLLVDGWYNQTKGGIEYAVKAWIDGTIQTRDVNSSGELFIEEGAGSLNNSWGQIKALGRVDNNNVGYLNADAQVIAADTRDDLRTTVAMLRDDGTLTPVDTAYNSLKETAILAMDNDKVPLYNQLNPGVAYQTVGQTYNGVREAYNGQGRSYDVRPTTTTKYYFVYNVDNYGTATGSGRTLGTVVKEYVGYQNLPTTNYAQYIEDVYAVGTAARSSSDIQYYAADIVVVELNDDYYRRQGGEIVFIPQFPTVGNNVVMDNVKVIRENGVMEEVSIDRVRSGLNEYDEANWYRQAGLYRMVRLSDSDVYYVTPMGAGEIANSGKVHTGLVDKAQIIQNNNYVSVWTFGKDVWDTNANVDVFGQTGTGYDIRTDDTRYYTLSYNDHGDAELNEKGLSEVLNGDPQMNTHNCLANFDDLRLRTYTPAMDEDRLQYNEVLVVYEEVNQKNMIKYVVSFNEFRGSGHNDAQDVWYQCMPTGAVNGLWTTYRNYTPSTANTDEAKYLARADEAVTNAVGVVTIPGTTQTQKDNALAELLAIRGDAEYTPVTPNTNNPFNYLPTQLRNRIDGLITTLTSNQGDLQTRIDNALSAAQAAIDSGDATALQNAKAALESLLNDTTITLSAAQRSALQSKLGAVNIEITGQVTVSVTGANVDVTINGESVASKTFDKSSTETVTVVIKAQTGFKIDSVNGAALATNGTYVVTLNGENVSFEVVTSAEDVTDVDVTVGSDGKATLSPVTAGKTYTVTLKPAEGVTLNGWHTIVTSKLDGCGKIQDGTFTFDYTVAADEGTSVEFTVEKKTLIGSEGDEELFIMKAVGAEVKLIPYQNLGYRAGARAFSDGLGPRDKGSVCIIEIGTETFTAVWDGEGYVITFETPEEAAEKVTTAMNQEPDPVTGLLTIDFDTTAKSVNGDATITRNDDGEITEVNLALEQPAAIGAKLPTTIVVDDEDGNKIEVEIQWTPNHEFAQPGVIYTYTVLNIKAADSSTGDNLAETVTVNKIDEDGEIIDSFEVSGEDVASGDGADVEEPPVISEISLTVDTTGVKTGTATVKVNDAAYGATVTAGDVITVEFTDVADNAVLSVTVNDDEQTVTNGVATYTVTGNETAIEVVVTATAEPQGKLVVKPFGEPANNTEMRTKVYDKLPMELQDGLTVTQDGNTYALEGTVIYNSAWTGAYGEGVDGYFIVLKMGYPEKAPSRIGVELYTTGSVKTGVNDKTAAADSEKWSVTEENVELGLFIKKLLLDEESNSFKNFTVKVGTESFTIDTSKLVPANASGEDAVLSVEAPEAGMIKSTDAMIGAGVGKKQLTDLQGQINVAFDGGKTFNLTGTVKYATGFSAWKTGETGGNYIALKFSYPGASTIKITNADEGTAVTDKTLTLNNSNKDNVNTNDADSYWVVIWKISSYVNGNRKPIELAVEGKTYTVDLNGLTLEKPDEELDLRGTEEGDETVTAVIGKDSDKKKVEDLQDNIEVTGPVANTYTVKGNVKYQNSFKGYSESAKGYFLALTFDYSGDSSNKIKITKKGDTAVANGGKELEEDGVLVIQIIDPTTSKNIGSFQFELAGTTYTVDVSNVKPVSGTGLESDLILQYNPYGTVREEFGNKEKSALVGEDFGFDLRDGEWYAVGTVLYNKWTDQGAWDANTQEGWYIPFTAVSASGTLKCWDTISNSWKEVKSGQEDYWYVGNIAGKRAEKLRFNVYDREIVVDLTELTYSAELTVEGYDKVTMTNGGTAVTVGDGISAVVEDGVVKISGKVFYQDKWTDWSSEGDLMSSGYFVALRVNQPGGGDVKVKKGLNKTDPVVSGTANAPTLVLKIADAAGGEKYNDRSFVIKSNDTEIKEWAIDFSGVTLVP